jgi:hypothetical protein
MYIIGWRSGANTLDAILAIKRHTNLSLAESKRLIKDALDGKSVMLPDDFVLREDLEDLGFKLS